MGSGLATYYKTETRSNAYNATDRYRFGGKELDTRGGLFHYDFGARHYDPVLPIFNGYDRRAEKYCHLSPFAYCAGNPVRFIDPTGEDYNEDITDNALCLRNVLVALNDLSYESALETSAVVNDNSGIYGLSIETDEGVVTIPIIYEVSVVKDENAYANGVSAEDYRKNAISQGVAKNVYIKRPYANQNNKAGDSNECIVTIFEGASSTTGAHEDGHMMGMLHDVNGLMTESANDINRTPFYSKKSVGEAIMRPNAPKGIYTTEKGVKCIYNNRSKYTPEQIQKGVIVKLK